MENSVNVSNEVDNDTWVSLDDAARILNLKKRYCSFALRKGFFKGKVGFRGPSKRNYVYNLADLKRVLEETTVPARNTER